MVWVPAFAGMTVWLAMHASHVAFATYTGKMRHYVSNATKDRHPRESGDPSGIGPRFRGDDGVVGDACKPCGVYYKYRKNAAGVEAEFGTVRPVWVRAQAPQETFASGILTREVRQDAEIAKRPTWRSLRLGELLLSIYQMPVAPAPRDERSILPPAFAQCRSLPDRELFSRMTGRIAARATSFICSAGTPRSPALPAPPWLAWPNDDTPKEHGHACHRTATVR